MQGTHTALHGVCTASRSSTQFKTRPRLNNAEQKRSPATPALLSQTESESCRCILGHAGPPGRLVQVRLATRGSEESSSFFGSRSGRFSPFTALLAREVIANTELAETEPPALEDIRRRVPLSAHSRLRHQLADTYLCFTVFLLKDVTG